MIIPPEFIQDPQALNQPDIAHIVGRDPERTPMLWDDSPNAGFSDEGTIPWLPIAADYASKNVIQQEGDPASMLNFYRALTTLRSTEPALNVGKYQGLELEEQDVYAYRKQGIQSDDFLVVLNFSSNPRIVDLNAVSFKAKIEISTNMQRIGETDLGNLILDPNEGLILRL